MEKINREKFALTLKEALLEKEVSQRTLAKAIGCSQSTVSTYVNGNRLPNDEKMEKICKILKLDLSDFSERESNTTDFNNSTIKTIKSYCQRKYDELESKKNFITKKRYAEAQAVCLTILGLMERD